MKKEQKTGSNRGVLALFVVLGVVVCGLIAGIVAITMGNNKFVINTNDEALAYLADYVGMNDPEGFIEAGDRALAAAASDDVKAYIYATRSGMLYNYNLNDNNIYLEQMLSDAYNAESLSPTAETAYMISVSEELAGNKEEAEEYLEKARERGLLDSGGRGQMTKKIKKVMIVCGLIICGALNVVLRMDTYAAWCGDISSTYNLSLYNACNLSGTRGALWLNDGESEWDLSDSITVTPEDIASGVKDIYLHGAVMGGTSSYAGYIIIQKGDSPISFSSNAEWYNTPDYGPLGSFTARQVWRQGFEHPWAGDDDFSGIFSGPPMELKLDLNKLMEEEGIQTSYNIPLQVYRCFQGYSPDFNPDDNCYSEASRLNVTTSASFEGRSNVWDADHTTGWFGSDEKNETYYIDNCSATKGCSVALSHHLRRNSGDGTTQYDIVKQTNGWSREPTSSETEEVTTNNLVPYVTVLRDTYTLYPGEKICETLNFSSKGDGNKDGHSTVCAVALGDASSSVDIQVRNDTLKTEYKKSVYAKPDDWITYKVIYNPTLQYAKDLIVDNAMMGQAAQVWGNSANLQTVFGQLTDMQYGNRYKGKLLWNNAFWTKGFYYDSGYRYNIGDSGRREEAMVPSQEVNDTETRAYIQKVIINPVADDGEIIHYGEDGDENKNVWATPTSISFRNNGGLFAHLKAETITESAAVYVPYNFNNTTTLEEVSDENRVVYAGEGAKDVSYLVKTEDRWNAVLNSSYSTRVDHAFSKLRICYDKGGKEECEDGEESSLGSLNVANGNGPRSERSVSSKLPSIPDLPAGTNIRVQSAVYPKDSHTDTTWELKDKIWWEEHCAKQNDDCWSFSDPVEYTVAKRPSFQVWGGSVSANTINAKSTKKTTIDGYSGKGRTFGSWAELTIVSNSNDDMASGAGFGYSGPNLDAKPGGGNENDTYDMLTFGGEANLSIPSVGSIRSELRLKEEDDKKDTDLTGGTFNKTTLFHITGNTPITGDITIEKDDVGNIPKVVIYSDGGINIECNVRRIDAILIANGDINTCSNISDLKKSAAAQNWLTINGAIKTSGTLELNRTYGAATGNNSIVPAEIINYDNSMMFIGGGSANTSASVDPSKLEVQHIRELAPRY